MNSSPIKAFCFLSVLTALLTSLASPLHADATTDWQSSTDALATQVLERSNIVSDFATLVGAHFESDNNESPGNLRIVINDDAIPRVDFSGNQIILPFGYLNDAIKSHATLVESREIALQHALDTFEYTLYHLFGHLLASDNSADADDIAESISSWLMIKGFTNGGEQWFNNTDAFGRASQLLDGPLQDYWHSHSLYKSRQRKINCWILGSAPEKHQNLLKPVLNPQERTARCQAEWQTLDMQMQTLLKDKLQTDTSLLNQ